MQNPALEQIKCTYLCQAPNTSDIAAAAPPQQKLHPSHVTAPARNQVAALILNIYIHPSGFSSSAHADAQGQRRLSSQPPPPPFPTLLFCDRCARDVTRGQARAALLGRPLSLSPCLRRARDIATGQARAALLGGSWMRRARAPVSIEFARASSWSSPLHSLSSLSDRGAKLLAEERRDGNPDPPLIGDATALPTAHTLPQPCHSAHVPPQPCHTQNP
jgi:hypothetical protein